MIHSRIETQESRYCIIIVVFSSSVSCAHVGRLMASIALELEPSSNSPPPAHHRLTTGQNYFEKLENMPSYLSYLQRSFTVETKPVAFETPPRNLMRIPKAPPRCCFMRVTTQDAPFMTIDFEEVKQIQLYRIVLSYK